MLVRDQHLPFEQSTLSDSQQAQSIIRKLIKTYGQSDREQFCVVLLNTKNAFIGLNIVSTGAVSYAHVSPREVLKPAILANAAAMILSHNHPSGDVSPSREDEAITIRIVQACHIIGIQVHEHLIISLCDDRYYSFARQWHDQEDLRRDRLIETLSEFQRGPFAMDGKWFFCLERR